MPTRNVVLTEYHEAIIDQLVKSGRYQNASEVLREGLRLIETRENRESARLQALREAAQTGFCELDDGRFTDVRDGDLDDFVASLGRRSEIRQRDAGG
jgi:antitoxin ParD1/3/4